MEQRAVAAEIRASAEDGSKRIVGYGAIFNSFSEPIGGLVRGSFRERIASNASV
jgi:phage head maturation protease